MVDRLPLAERKRRQARERIVRAAEELFAERGFDAVSVAEIADRADVGRTTFFRHFGDKQEVVFAQEQDQVAIIAAAHQNVDAPAPATLQQAIEQLREIVMALCAQATQDPDSYTRHYEFIEQNPELRARDALKMQSFAGLLSDILLTRGADPDLAVLASQIALACFEAAKRRHVNDPRALASDTEVVFAEALSLGRTAVS